MIKAVLDTNILVSGLISPHGSPAKIINLFGQKKFALVASEKILAELKTVLHYPKIFKKYHLDKNQIEKYLKILRAFAEIVSPTLRIRKVLADPADDKFLETCLFADTRFLVSGDKHLLAIKNYQGIKIIKACDFLKILKR